MIIALNDSSDVPIYLQLRNQIVQGISDGQLAPGEQLPTVRALAAEIGINSMTVSKAYQLLKQEGFIYSDRRNGARVRENFKQGKGLSENQRELLKLLISEAQINGMSKEDFFRECEAFFKEENEKENKKKGRK